MSAGLLMLAACGGEAPASDAAPAEAVAAKPKITATVVDQSMLNLFLVVPSSGDTGAVLADGSAYEIRSVGVDRTSAGDGDGVLVRVQPEYTAKLGGRKVRVTVRARTSPTDGAPAFKVMYYRSGSNGGSGWQDFTPTAEFAPYAFEYAVPDVTSTTGVDNIGFWADPEGKGRGIEVSGVTVETID